MVNLGNPEEITITELARKVIAVTAADVGIDYVPYEEAYEEGFEDMVRRVPDITKVQALTGYSPARRWNGGVANSRRLLENRIVEQS